MPSTRPMTIEQLRRHIDKRLRTKADKGDLRRIEGRLTAHDRRFDSLEEKLNAVLRALNRWHTEDPMILDDHERRLLDLEAAPPR